MHNFVVVNARVSCDLGFYFYVAIIFLRDFKTIFTATSAWATVGLVRGRKILTTHRWIDRQFE